MPRHAGAVLLAVAVLFVACDRGPDPADVRREALVAEAEEIAGLMGAGDYAAVTSRFADDLVLSPEGLGDIWEQFDRSLGGFVGIAADSATGFSEGVDIVDTPLRYDSDVLKQRVTFNADGEVAGYFLLLLSAPLPQESPP